MDHHLSLATIHQLRAQFRSFQTYLESLRVAPSYIDLLCNLQEGTLVADPVQPDCVYQTYGDLIGAHHCRTATVTLNWPSYRLTRDGQRYIPVKTLCGREADNLGMSLPLRVLVDTTTKSDQQRAEQPLALMQIHRSRDTHYLALQAKANQTYYWVDHDRKPTTSAPTPVTVHNWLQDANRRAPWRANWMNDSAAAEYRIDVQPVLCDQPDDLTDEPEIADEPEITDEDALNLKGAEWTRTLRHSGKAGRVLASAISKLKSVAHIEDTATVLSKIIDVLR